MTCPHCGAAGHLAGDQAALAAADVERAEIHTAAELEHDEQQTERNADDNATAEAIAQIHADADVETARIEAAADVETARIEAETVEEVLETVTEAAEIESADAGDATDTDTADEPAETATDDDTPAVTAIEVPPQLEDETDSSENETSSSRPRRRPSFGGGRGRRR